MRVLDRYTAARCFIVKGLALVAALLVLPVFAFADDPEPPDAEPGRYDTPAPAPTPGPDAGDEEKPRGRPVEAAPDQTRVPDPEDLEFTEDEAPPDPEQ